MRLNVLTMGSTLILNARLYFKSFQPFCQQERTVFLTLKTQLLPSARCLCTRDPKLGGRGLDRRNHEGRDKNITLRQKPSFPKSVFVAGMSKRRAETSMRKSPLLMKDLEYEEMNEKKTTRGGVKIQPPDRPLSAAEWKKLKESHGNSSRFETQMMCSLSNSSAQLNIAKSLLTFVSMETGTLSYEILLHYLLLCVNGGYDIEIFDLYDLMKGNFPCLETGASSLFIKGFSQTERWREAISILEEVKKVFCPSARNYGSVIEGAVLHNDMTTAWSLYDELLEKELVPFQDTWAVLFEGASRVGVEEGEGISQAEQNERLLGILMHMRNNSIYPQLSLAKTIKTWFESLKGQKWTGNWTSITPKGLCKCCGSDLESIQLTDEEYQHLKTRVMNDVIKGKDVFKKTTPEELKQFQVFMQHKRPFDVVVDGLNVANISDDRTKSETLLAVVSELKDRGMNILVLGRKHMLRSARQRHNMNSIRQKAHCFFTDDISEDDPFLLYATLHSGNHCLFVTRDLMRDHKACLPDESTRRLFFKWQRGHQLVVSGYVALGKRVHFQRISHYDTIVQTSGNTWHIPFDEDEDRKTFEVPQKWLCLTKRN